MRVAKVPDAFFEPFYLDFPLKTLPVLPADLLSVLGSGMVWAGPFPAVAILEGKELLKTLPFCLAASEGFALVLGEGIGEEVELGLGRSVAGSLVYAQVLLRFSFGVKRLWVIPDARPDETPLYLAEAEEAVRLARELPVALDVAQEWLRWSGTPAVFYVWAVQKGAPDERVVALSEALDSSLQRFAAEPRSWRAERLGLDPRQMLAQVSYRLGRGESRGLSFLNQVRSLISEG